MAKALTKEEKLKIINSDFELWAKNFIKITNMQGEVVPFVLNKEQRDFIENMQKFNIILKSRQIGFSTLSLALMLYTAFTQPASTCLLVCYDELSLTNLFDRLKFMYEHVPEKYRIPAKICNRDTLQLENESKIYVKVANKNIARSFTCQIIHLSEFAFYKDEEQEQILTACEQALAKNENSKIIIESTANGMNFFYELFMKAYKKKSKYKAFFYPWFAQGAKEQFSFEIKQAVNWYRSINRGLRLSKKPHELSKYEERLLEEGANLEQLMWRRWKLQDMSEEQFMQEYPSFPEEAFISKNVYVFDAGRILERYNYLPEPLTLKEVGELPLELERYLNKGLYIYQTPKQGEWYFAGVDVSAGLKRDYSAVSIFDTGGEQVCTFYRNDLAVYQFAEVLNKLGKYYNYAMLLIERNSYGLDLIQRMRQDYNYINLLRMKRFDAKGGVHFEIGWEQTNNTKAKLISDFKEAFEKGLILLNDKETLDQMRVFVEYEGKKYSNKKAAQYHDDLVIATALALQCLKQNKYYV